jgi:hypothetical protein
MSIISSFAIVFTGKMPRGLWDFEVNIIRWRARSNAYVALLRDEYPPFSFDGAGVIYPTTLTLPDFPEERNRGTVAIRIILAVPHIIALLFIGIAWAITALIGWLLARAKANRHEQQLSSDLAVAQAQIKSQQQLDQERQTALQLSMERLTAEFDEVAGSSLRANNETFLQLAREHLGQHQQVASAALSERKSHRDHGRADQRSAQQNRTTDWSHRKRTRRNLWRTAYVSGNRDARSTSPAKRNSQSGNGSASP